MKSTFTGSEDNIEYKQFLNGKDLYVTTTYRVQKTMLSMLHRGITNIFWCKREEKKMYAYNTH